MRKILSILIIGFGILFNMTAYADAPKTWTFLIFLNGDNSLDHYGEMNIKQMEQVGSNDQVNVVVQWASMDAGKAVRMLIQKSKDPDHVTSPIVQDLGRVDMGDVNSLKDFIQWGVQNYPAEHYFINVWDHGDGWHDLALRNHQRTLFQPHDISHDDFTGHVITTEQLGQAMVYAAQVIGHKVDIYGSDACLMAMAEVANEMSNAVSISVGSEETEPGPGWPYTELLSDWEAIPQATPEQVAKTLVHDYVKSYQGGSNGTLFRITFAAFDLSNVALFDQAIADFGTKIRFLNPAEQQQLLGAVKNSRHFFLNDYVDFLDFIKKLSATDVKLDPQIMAKVQDAATKVIIAHEASIDYGDATGMSIWLPVERYTYDRDIARYKGLQFNAASHWGDTLDFLASNMNNYDPPVLRK